VDVPRREDCQGDWAAPFERSGSIVEAVVDTRTGQRGPFFGSGGGVWTHFPDGVTTSGCSGTSPRAEAHVAQTRWYGSPAVAELVRVSSRS
jgi:hypothetical protein